MEGFTFYYKSVAGPGSEYYRIYLERAHDYYAHDWVPLDDAAIARLLKIGYLMNNETTTQKWLIQVLFSTTVQVLKYSK